jgi:hypothetical protein
VGRAKPNLLWGARLGAPIKDRFEALVYVAKCRWAARLVELEARITRTRP